MENTHNIAPEKLEMLMAIVPKDKTAFFTSLIRQHQANMEFVVAAEGTTHLVLNYLGLTKSPKNLIISVIRTDEAASLMELLEETFKKGSNYKGVAYTIRLTSVIGTLVYGFLANDRQTVKEEA